MEQAEKRHGGYQLKAGRKSKYGVKTIVMCVPESECTPLVEALLEVIVELSEKKALPA
jgi:hypothetical protein